MSKPSGFTKVGYLSWKKGEQRPRVDDVEACHTLPLTEDDRKHGYVSVPLYTLDEDKPS